jgi:radical SAM superfamily enzyme YgiQ (UPF0313 family)
MRVPEGLIIRPPSEAGSLLLRVVRGCHWNRCRFCGIYEAYGQPFETRPVQDVLEDIDLLKEYWGDHARTAFLGDADPLQRPAAELVPILKRLRERFPTVERVTAYARASSIYNKSLEELQALRASGLDRVHVGLETGSEALLRFHKKGISQRILIDSGQKARRAGIELSYYVLLGLGGIDRWEEHMVETAKVINRTCPEFIRIRRLWIHPHTKLAEEIRKGLFREQPPEGTVNELRLLVEHITVDGPHLTCDHANNYLPLRGNLLGDKQAMLEEIDTFLGLPEEARERHYRAVGSVI